MKKVIFILMCCGVFIFTCCKPQKTLVEKSSVIKSDTLYNKVETVISPPILSSLFINNLCDSITGKAKEFKNRVIIDKDTVYVEVIDNELNITINRLKNIMSKKDSTYKAELLKIRNSKETTKETPYIPKWIWYFLVVLLAYILAVHIFVKLPSIINSFIRKLIGLI